jgi:pyruvate,water dikinase
LEHERLMNELRANRPDLSAMSDRELIERGLALADQYMEMLFTEHIFISFLATLPIGIITSVCEAVGRPGDTLKLLAGLGDVESAAPAMAMWDLGRMAAASPDVSALFDGGYAGLYERLVGSDSPDAAAFLEAFEDFSFRYGCRGPNEWEARSPTWETEPDLALAAIDRMRLSDETAAPKLHNADRAAEREKIGAEITAMLAGKPEDQQKFQAALHSATVFMPGRERTKTNNIKLIQELRVALHEFGRRRVADGTFHKANDFGLLTRAELLEAIDDPGKFTGVLAEREALMDEVAALQEPFLFHGGRPDMSTYPRRDAVEITEVVGGEAVKGVPGCPGVATGIARVVLDSHDPTALAPGDILVAPITDPSWTPLFVPAAGVVVDVGAPLSHAIIVSRELGIPCVVSATDATKRIPDGALIEVNGDTGVVTIIELP